MGLEKKNEGLGVFIAIVVIVVLVTVFKFLIPEGNPGRNEGHAQRGGARTPFSAIARNSGIDRTFHIPGQKYIARLYIVGTIQEENNTYSQKWLLDTVRDLADDPDNAGLILSINSPGGTVYEADELYLALLEYRKAKPVYAYFESMAASGGYYIGCAASYISANRNTLTGSIGVIAGQSLDLTGLMERYGIKSETIHAGRNKNMGGYNEPLSDEQRAIMQSLADECYEQFTGIVAESRGLDIQKVRLLADGRVYTAKQALDAGLVDSIGTFDGLVSKMQEAEFEGRELPVEDYKYERNLGFYDYLFSAASKIVPLRSESASGLPEAVEKIIDPGLKYPAYIMQ